MTEWIPRCAQRNDTRTDSSDGKMLGGSWRWPLRPVISRLVKAAPSLLLPFSLFGCFDYRPMTEGDLSTRATRPDIIAALLIDFYRTAFCVQAPSLVASPYCRVATGFSHSMHWLIREIASRESIAKHRVRVTIDRREKHPSTITTLTWFPPISSSLLIHFYPP